MKRVNIIGPPGSGKSTLGRKLSRNTGLELIHLDRIAHSKKYDALNNKPAFIKKVSEICNKDIWIIEGVYNSTLDDRLKRADLTIVLSTPRYKCTYRVLKRRFFPNKQERSEELHTDWQEKLNWEFIKYVWTFDKKKMPEIRDMISNHKSIRVVELKSDKDIETFLNDID